jgi:hypothetical protein
MATKIAIEVDVKTQGAVSEIDELKQQMVKLQATTNELKGKMEGGFKSAEKGAEGASKGMKGFGGSIGGVIKSLGLIAVAMEVFMFLKDLLMKNQKVADALGIVFKTIEVLFNQLFKAVEPLGDALMAAFENPQQALEDLWSAIKTNFLNRIKGIAVAAEGVGKVIQGAFSLDWDMVTEGMQQYGQALVQVTTGLDIEQQNAFINGVVEAGVAAFDTASKIQELTNEVKLAEAQQQLLLFQYQREAELQRQIRDDVSKTIGERQNANIRLGGILDEQATEEKKLFDKRKDLADLNLSINEDSIDAQVEVINAEKDLADLRERITGQRSEQLTNANALIAENVALLKEQKKAAEEEAQAEADAAYAIAEAKIAAEELLKAYKAERQSMTAEEMMQAEINAALVAEELKFQAALNAATEMGILQEEIDELELAQIDERLRLENDIRAKYAAQEIALAEQIAKDKKAIQKKSNTDAIKAEVDLKNAKIGAAQATANALGQIAGFLEQQGAAGVAAAKGFAIAELAINTAIAISAAIAGATGAAATPPTPATPFLQVAYIASMVGSVVAAVAQAQQILGGVPGPSGGNVTGGISAPAAPSMSTLATSTTEITNADAAQLAPIQAFVVESQLSGSQENIQQIQNQATFGLTG